MALSGLRLFGVELLGGDDAIPPSAPLTVITFRELGALVRRAPYRSVGTADGEMSEYRRVIDDVFQRATILPAPFGTVFRSGDQVSHWLEMNHIALAEGLHFIEGRCEARLHVRRKAETVEMRASDAANVAAESFRILRREAAAAVPLRLTGTSGGEAIVEFSGAFLVPREGWGEFSERVGEQALRWDTLEFELTGPWPPYDFVRIDFGA